MSASQAADHNSVLVGLIGKGIQRSKSPALHQHEGDALGIRCLYQLIDLADLNLEADSLEHLLASAELMGFAGLNITHPCKQAVIPLLHELSEDARAIGAVNTVKFSAGRRVGYNTDAEGFAESFRRGLAGAPLQRVAQLGAGGAGAATAYSLLKLGVRQLAIYDVDTHKTRALAGSLGQIFEPGRIRVTEDPREALGGAQGLVNSTPVGTREHPGMPLPESLLRSDLWVADIVYFPLQTPLLQYAKKSGCRTLGGGGMVVFQAAAAFKIFTGLEADGERMLEHFGSLPED